MHDECINTLVHYMKSMGVGVEKNLKEPAIINESEVSKEAIASMNINEILDHIATYEESILHELTLPTV